MRGFFGLDVRSRLRPGSCLLLLWLLASGDVLADGPADNQADRVRRVPPPGMAVPALVREELAAGVRGLEDGIQLARVELKHRKALLELLPDIQIFSKAVRWALDYDEFYPAKHKGRDEFECARLLLRQGGERLAQLRDGRSPWTRATGLVVRGYQSRIDQSIQPYALVVPSGAAAVGSQPWRLDFWFHGRGETLTELAFLTDRQADPGEFAPTQAIVLHLYGRYCNANRFAGEEDLFEALAHVRQDYPIDERRLVVRGFSMGGAACWQFATHHAGLWAAAAPGAGFSETADFLKVFQKEKLQPAPWEQKLWHWYDSTDYALNLYQVPTVAYSGTDDSQKQAADQMARAMKTNGLELTHILGPRTGHRYEPAAKAEINRRIDAIAAVGRDLVPNRIRFATHTLRYNRMLWLQVDGLQAHWERATVLAEMDPAANRVTLGTTNVTALSLDFGPGLCPLDPGRPLQVVVDGRTFRPAGPASDRSWTIHLARAGRSKGPWALTPEAGVGGGLRKQHGLQGPIDDAFMDSFLMVRPGGAGFHERTDAWVTSELSRATDHWRRQFRGELAVRGDGEVTEEDIARHHLILWGDPQSNKVLGRILDRLPLKWTREAVQLAGSPVDGSRHMPVLVFPNPLNPRRYVVLNSGFTFRDYDYLNNARQTAKLPDYALIDVGVSPGSRAAGGIVRAGFFSETWGLGDRVVGR